MLDKMEEDKPFDLMAVLIRQVEKSRERARRNLFWHRVRAWVILELVIAFVLYALIPSHAMESYRRLWEIPTVGPPIAILTVIFMQAFATFVVYAVLLIAPGIAQNLGINQPIE